MSRPKTLFYLQYAISKAKKDLDDMVKKMEIYLTPLTRDASGRRLLREQMEMKKNGFNIYDEVKKQVELQFVISDLGHILFSEKLRQK